MAVLPDFGIRNLADLARIEAEMTLDERLPERSVLDVFIGGAARQPDRTAITMLMSGAPDEQPRRVSYRELLGLVRRAANLFAMLGGARPGVAYLLPSLVETHATLWGAETAGYAVPINFLLQPEPIAALLEASGARILVALGPHPVLDIWPKALALRERVPGLQLLRVAASGIAGTAGTAGPPLEAGVIDFHSALAAQPDDHLVFGEAGRDADVAAYFHTGGTTGTPKLVAHTHRSQLVAALGGALLGDMRASDTMTATLPLFHVGGTIYSSLSAFMAGMGMLVMSPGGLRNPAMVSGFWRLVAQYRATRVGAVPTSIGAVLQVPLEGADISSVRAGFTRAASLPPAVAERFHEVTGRRLHEVYGMTEASGLIAIHPLADEGGDGSVGWALPYTGGAGGRGGHARRLCRRAAGVLRGPAPQRQHHRSRTARARAAQDRRAPRVAQADPYRRCDPADLGGQDLQAATALRRRSAAGDARRARAAGAAHSAGPSHRGRAARPAREGHAAGGRPCGSTGGRASPGGLSVRGAGRGAVMSAWALGGAA